MEGLLSDLKGSEGQFTNAKGELVNTTENMKNQLEAGKRFLKEISNETKAKSEIPNKQADEGSNTSNEPIPTSKGSETKTGVSENTQTTTENIGGQDALRINSPEGQVSHIGEGGENISGSSEGVRPSEQGNAPTETQQKSESTGEEKVSIHAEKPPLVLTHRGLQELATDVGLEDVTPRERQSRLRQLKEANDLIDTWKNDGTYAKNISDVIKRASEGKIDEVEQKVLASHLATLRDSLDKIAKTKGANSEEYKKIYDKLYEAKQAAQIMRSKAGGLLGDKAIGIPDDTLEGFLSQKQDANDGAELTEQQVAKTEKIYKEYEEKLQKETALREEAERKYNDLLAQKELNKTKPKTETGKKKTKEDYVSERKKFKDELKAAKEEHEKYLRENGIQQMGLSGITLTPKMVKAISKIVGSYAEELGSNLKEVTEKVFEEVKEFFNGITKDDITDIIAGVYKEPQKTRTQLQTDLADLRTEASLIKKLEDVKNGVPKTEKQKQQKNDNINNLQKQLRDLKKEVGYDDETKLKTILARNEAETKKIQERIKNKQYETEEKTSFIDNPEFKTKYPDLYKKVLDAIAAREDAKHKLALDNYLDQQAKRKLGSKIADTAASIIATSRAIVSGIDDSFVLMQAYYAMLANPKTGASAFKEHALDAFSEKRFNREIAALHNSKNWDVIQKSGLDVLEPKSLHEGKVEEMFDKNILNKTFRLKNGKEVDLKKVNFLRPFERAFTSMGNNMRVKLFEERMQTLQEHGKTFESHPKEYKSAARVINEMVGRGKQNKYIEIANPVITPFIWSPKLISSGLNLLGVSDLLSLANGSRWGTEGFYRKLTPAQRKYAFAQIGRGIGTGVAIMGVAALAGAQVDFDPRSVTFGNVTIGNTQVNVFGRLAPYVKGVVQSVTGTRVKNGEEQDINVGRNPKTVGGVWGSILRSKLTPSAGIGFDYFMNAGKDFYSKEKITPLDAVKKTFVPIGLQNIGKQLERDGSLATLEFLGSFFGLQVNDKRDFQKEEQLVDWDKAADTYANSEDSDVGLNMQVRDPKTREWRKMNDDELKKFRAERDRLSKIELDDIKKNGLDMIVNEQPTTIPFDKLTEGQLKEEMKKRNTKISQDVKDKMFPETQAEKNKKKREDKMLERYKKSQTH